jgi:hypothetical protein
VRDRSTDGKVPSTRVEYFEEDTDGFGSEEDVPIKDQDPPASAETGAAPVTRFRPGFGILGLVALALVAAALVASSLIGIRSESEATDEEPTSFATRFAGRLAGTDDMTRASERPSRPLPILSISQSDIRGAQAAVPLLASLSGPIEGCTVLIEGLAEGSTLNVGQPSGATGWRVSSTDIAAASVRPPHGFVGAMDLVVELRQPDDSVADRKRMHIEWVRSASPAEQPDGLRGENQVPSGARDRVEEREALFRQFLEWQKKQPTGR